MCIRDSTNTAPTDLIGPYEQWGDAQKIVSIDPWGASVQSVYLDYLEQGYDIRPTIAVTKAHIHLCLLYTSPSPRDRTRSRMPSSA